MAWRVRGGLCAVCVSCVGVGVEQGGVGETRTAGLLSRRQQIAQRLWHPTAPAAASDGGTGALAGCSLAAAAAAATRCGGRPHARLRSWRRPCLDADYSEGHRLPMQSQR